MPSNAMENLLFLKNSLNDRDIASIMPTSLFAVKRICRKIDFSKDNIIVGCGQAQGHSAGLS